MGAIEIIANNLLSEGLDPMPVLNFIHKGVTNGNCALTHIQDSVFVVIYISLEDAVLHLFSTDTPIRLKSNIQELQRRIERSSIQRIYGHADNPKLLKLLISMGYAIEDSNRSEFGWMLDINALRFCTK